MKRRTVYIGDGKFICEMRIHSNRKVGSIITVIYIYILVYEEAHSSFLGLIRRLTFVHFWQR